MQATGCVVDSLGACEQADYADSKGILLCCPRMYTGARDTPAVERPARECDECERMEP